MHGASRNAYGKVPQPVAAALTSLSRLVRRSCIIEVAPTYYSSAVGVAQSPSVAQETGLHIVGPALCFYHMPDRIPTTLPSRLVGLREPID